MNPPGNHAAAINGLVRRSARPARTAIDLLAALDDVFDNAYSDVLLETATLLELECGGSEALIDQRNQHIAKALYAELSWRKNLNL